jgi:UDP-N-acetylglucosamine 1-carboxyvinyltransferase
MEALLIEGPSRLKGGIRISGSKNTALPLLFSSLLFDEVVTFENVPRLWDIETTLKLLESMGAESDWDKEKGRIQIHPTIHTKVAPYEWVKKMRAGILALGPLVAKYGEAKVSLPGGCAIGARPVDYHLDAMRLMGVSVSVEQGYIHARILGRLKAAHINFPQVTVTGTENLLILAAVAEGTTVIDNAACEPEVVALGELLKRCGADIVGLGTAHIQIRGGELRAPREPVVIPPDRIESGTWLAIAAATRSEIELEQFDADQMKAVVEAFTRLGLKIEKRPGPMSVRVVPADRYEPLDIDTAPYPGFPTDMQAQLLSVLCLADGTSRIRENIFENRFMHVAELRRMGARIDVQGNLSVIDGPIRLQGAPIMATDLRASASLVVAALCAQGQTTISRIYHLDRGYQRLDEKLRSLGASVTRISDSL